MGWIGSGALVLWLALLAAGCTETTTMHRLRVSRHDTADISDARAARILADMTTIARTRDHDGDVAANVRFARDGAVSVFNEGTGIIDTASQFDAVLALPGDVKVVREIHWCGGIAPNVIGCARLSGDSLVVVRWAHEEEGILWLHEFGHIRGLEHRDVPTAVMNPTITPDRRDLNRSEARAIERTRP